MITLEAGVEAPGFRLEFAGRGMTSLDELVAEGPVLLAFYKVTCPTCQLTLPYLQRLEGGKYRVLAVSQDPADMVQEFNDAFEVELPNLLDKAGEGYPASNAYGITHVPTLFAVEQDKRIAWQSTGFQKRELEELAKLAGKPIFRPGDKPPESKYG
jgi:peroxiredoxin